MAILQKLKEHFSRDSVTLDLQDIQALILRSRPEPYVGVHAMLHFDEAAGARNLLGRLAPHIASADNWSEDLDFWIGAALSFEGLKALGVPDAQLKTFPLPFQQGMAARAEQLRDFGPNAPENWEDAFKPGNCHLALTIYAVNDAALDKALATARAELDRSSGVTLLGEHRFGAPDGAKNPFGFRDSISQPAVEGSGVDPLPGEERPIKAGEFILGYESENGQPLGMPEPAVLGRNGTFVVMRKYNSRVGCFNAFLKAHGDTPEERERLAAKMFGRWRSGAPLTLAHDHDDPDLGSDRRVLRALERWHPGYGVVLADAVADLEAGDVGPHRLDHAGDLMARHHRATQIGQVSIHHVQVSAADATGVHLDQQLPRSGFRQGALHGA